jgi:hypothetical protein
VIELTSNEICIRCLDIGVWLYTPFELFTWQDDWISVCVVGRRDMVLLKGFQKRFILVVRTDVLIFPDN